MKTNTNSERGQALIMIVIGLVVLLGFTALAIDGGMVFSDRRHAQNAADAAALAGALQKANLNSDSDAIMAALNSAGSNGFGDPQVDVQISEHNNYSGGYYLVTVDITSTTETSLAKLFIGNSITNRVTATARARWSQPALPGYALASMGNCVAEGDNLLGTTGGGNSGGIESFDGGMFVNAPETSGNQCSIDPPSSSGATGIIAEPGYQISSVGSVNYGGVGNLSPTPIETGINGGSPIDDPLANLPVPTCKFNGSVAPGSPAQYNPGKFKGSMISSGVYAPGIYCIDGNVKLSGKEGIVGDGVLFYFMNGSLEFTGQAGLSITGPTLDNCLGPAGESWASCTYMGMAIFSSRSNTNTIEVRGNGGSAVVGMIYAMRGTVMARGGGSTPDETEVWGQIIARRVLNNGNGSLRVTFNPSSTVWKKPEISLER